MVLYHAKSGEFCNNNGYLYLYGFARYCRKNLRWTNLHSLFPPIIRRGTLFHAIVRKNKSRVSIVPHNSLVKIGAKWCFRMSHNGSFEVVLAAPLCIHQIATLLRVLHTTPVKYPILLTFFVPFYRAMQ